LPTAILRFQILLIELLVNNYLSFEEDWCFNVFCKEDLGNFAELAIDDLLNWFGNLYKLKNKIDFINPKIVINSTNLKENFQVKTKEISIDFSLFERYTDENTIVSEDLIFVRTDYFGKEKNYFRVSTAEPLNYNIKEEDKPCLEFFLQNIFDKPGFRDGQFPIISNALNRKDTIGLLPTGGGKSLCYQLPCLLQPCINFVVCPIKSLMYDQKINLENAFITNTNFITSDLTSEERTKVQNKFVEGKYLFVWISPERFQITDFRGYLAAINSHSSIAYAVVDEVHCLSEWGHDFRTSYLNLAKTIEKYCPNAKFIGLTATASVNVLKDIKIEFARQRKNLDDDNIKSLLDYSRKELVFDIILDGGNKKSVIEEKLQELKNNEGFFETDKKAGLVFTPHVNGEFGCYDISNNLNLKFGRQVKWYSGEVPTKNISIDISVEESNDRDVVSQIVKRRIVELYPNSLETEINEILRNYRYPVISTNRSNSNRRSIELGKIPVLSDKLFKEYKNDVQKKFKFNTFPLMVATKAFGMGIDKPNIEYTFHYGLPSSVEALYQEAGRAGRWGKKNIENTEKQAKCYVFYSKETTDIENIERLFNKDTTFAQIKEINARVGRDGKHVFRQIFLYLQGQKDIAQDFKTMNEIIIEYFQPNEKVLIWWINARDKLGVDEKVLQKAIYKLSLLGIVKDWAVDFGNEFYEVEFNTKDNSSIQEALSSYILKYEPNLKIVEELKKLELSNIKEKCIWYLLQWTFENISYNRKQSLKTLVDWCNDFTEIGNEAFKKRIDNYFRFTDTTFIFQHISENPMDYKKWFEVFNRITKDVNSLQNETKIFIPSIENEYEKKMEFERLRDSLSRFLESYRNNTGLNLVSGVVRLFLKDYENPDGQSRFESAFEKISGKDFEEYSQKKILVFTIEMGRFLDEDEKVKLCFSILKYYPELTEQLAKKYDLPYLLNDPLDKKLQELKSINKYLYEQFAEI